MNDLRLRSKRTYVGSVVKNCDIPEPFNMPLESFLTGGLGRDLDIDNIFCGNFREILDGYGPKKLEFGATSPSALVEGYNVCLLNAGVDHGVVLRSPSNEIVGAYIGCLLGLDAKHQGLGLGAELVFDFVCNFGSLPTWYLDVPAYSPAGLAAHTRAWHLARSADFLKAKGIIAHVI
jgi:hypothetical protein